jgi:hypothetical protein
MFLRQNAIFRRTPLLWFLGVAAGIYAAALGVAAQLPRLDAGVDAVTISLTFDLVVVIPVAFYVIVVRRRGWPIVTLAPVFILSLLAASRVLPADHQQTLRALEALAVPIELGLLTWIGWRAARAVRYARGDGDRDPFERIRRAALELMHNDRAAAILATEVAVFYYGIGSWGARPHAPAGTVAFTHYRRSGHAGMVFAVILAMTVEGLAAHVLLQTWSALLAWILTIGTAYGALWLIADYRMTVLRPILVSDNSVIVRAGLRCTIRVPLKQIAEVGRVKPDFGKQSVNLTFLGTPTHWLTLTEAMEIEGPYGLRRGVRAIGLELDAADDFERTFNNVLLK